MAAFRIRVPFIFSLLPAVSLLAFLRAFALAPCMPKSSPQKPANFLLGLSLVTED